MIRKLGGLHGLILGLLVVFGAYMIEGGSFRALFLISPIIIVFGGTFSATIIGFGWEKFFGAFKLIKLAYNPKKYEVKYLIEIFVELSKKSRQEGLLSVEKDLFRLKYQFPQKLIKYVLDGTDPVSLETIALTEIKSMQERHYSNVHIFSKMGGYSPTMGILGTVMALIITLANAGNDPNVLIQSIATAFIATLWGVFSANLIWFPIADRLKQCHLEEKHMMEISLEGVLALQSGEIPTIIKSRMISMLPQREQQELIAA
jgi:chemotaxis protein MotA